ncbi:EamA family transporter [Flavobacterium macacae]|mgnify:CR=1 FL=1|uniref:EamA family transporter n=1 Tax=Flavobacterium macacae TaxID=2488993 RepID=A0A3P3WFQ7_9FLAO|nr:EamA family transporter [Flavobacterium macacae]RRJ91383.1 EamA family transporter [Flavobacterium macacae]
MSTSKHFSAAIAAFIIWGFFSLALKPLHHYPSLDILFYRVFLCVILMLGINLIFRRNVLKETKDNFLAMSKKQKKEAFLLTLGGAILLTANWFFFIYVMNHVSVKSAAFAYLVCPILTTVFAYFILEEKLNKWQWTAVALSVFSCILLGFNHLMDVFYSVIIAATYALYLVSQRKNKAIDKFLLLTLQLTTSAVILLPFFPFYRGEVPTEISFYVYIAIISVFFTIIPLFLNLFALKEMSSASVGILLYINPLINFFLAIFYYKEEITPFQIVAYSLIFLSIIVFNVKTIFKSKVETLPLN